ncbi:S-adenosyl-L-methionine-dependent methyltransferase [Serendipita vermifera]|nr:S-adenosyl-L-methionine-dependent methyltransferase [Serendipita vermifera]
MTTRAVMYSQNPNPKLNSSVQQAPSRTPRRAASPNTSTSADLAGTEASSALNAGSEEGRQVVVDPSTSDVNEDGEKDGEVYQEPPPFGSRFLTEDSDVWSKNAWDHVPPPEGHDTVIQRALELQRSTPVSQTEKEKYNSKPAKYWDLFYKYNEGNFFKDRKWLHNEFPELLEASSETAPPTRIVEVGCGTGSTTFPLLSINENPDLEIFACDYSSKAIQVVQSNPIYSSPPKGRVHASVWDLSTSEGLPEGVEEGSVDIVVMIFVLSALHPTEWAQAVANIYKMLKPGGMLLMRDYGRYDLAQIRFKKDRLLEDNLYVRGDGTRVYFFTIDEISTLFTGEPHIPTLAEPITVHESTEMEETLEGIASPTLLTSPSHEDSRVPSGSTSPDPLPSQTVDSITKALNQVQFTKTPTSGGANTPIGSAETPDPLSRRWIPEASFPGCPPHPLFKMEQLGVDRRLIVNRKRQLKMYRVWIQAKYRKALT